MKMYANGFGHMAKMATVPLYGKNPLKIFSGTKRSMVLGCSIGDMGQVCTNDGSGLTLTYFKT